MAQISQIRKKVQRNLHLSTVEALIPAFLFIIISDSFQRRWVDVQLNSVGCCLPKQRSLVFGVYARICGCKVERIGDLSVGFSEAWQDKRMAGI